MMSSSCLVMLFNGMVILCSEVVLGMQRFIVLGICTWDGYAL